MAACAPSELIRVQKLWEDSCIRSIRSMHERNDALAENKRLRAFLLEIKNLAFGHTGHDYQHIEELAREALGDK